MKCQEVAVPQEGFKPAGKEAGTLNVCRGDHWVKDKNLAFERLQPVGHFLANAAKADHANGHFFQDAHLVQTAG